MQTRKIALLLDDATNHTMGRELSNVDIILLPPNMINGNFTLSTTCSAWGIKLNWPKYKTTMILGMVVGVMGGMIRKVDLCY